MLFLACSPATALRHGFRHATLHAIRPVRRALLALGAASPLLLLCLGVDSAHASMPSPADVQARHRSSDTLLLDRHGEVLHRLRSNANVRQGPWVTLDQVSPAMRMALILSEDKDFYAHSGVNWSAVTAAAWANVWNTRTRGASTLTMQLAGLLYEDLRASTQSRTLGQKISQAWTAKQLERSWKKHEILEAYLNLVPFRGELVGIDALAWSMFAKAPSGLNAQEAAIAVALIRGPNAPAPRVAQRACHIVRAVQQARALPVDAGCEAMDMLTDAALLRRAQPASAGDAPHLARRALQHWRSTAAPDVSPPASLRTTLDAGTQRLAIERLQAHLRQLRTRNVEDGAVLVLDNASGEVLAWVGSSGQLSQAQDMDGVMARRQPGSTLKPFLYAQAIAEQRLTAASLLDDSPAQVQTSAGLYSPSNHSGQYQGWVSVRTALASSLNIPAVRTLALVGPEAFTQQLNRLGLRLQQSGSHYGLSLALGSAEVTLFDLSNAYRTLANGGQHRPAHWLPEADRPPVVAPEPVLDAGSSFIVAHMLSDPMARAPSFGTASVLATRSWSAVKTGTSKDMRDNWALGWSDRYTVGVWVGNASGDAMWDVSGVSGAAPVWADLMHALHRTQASHAPKPPRTVLAQTIAYGPRSLNPDAPPIEAPRQEWFLQGTEQSHFTVPARWLADSARPQNQPQHAAADAGQRRADHAGATTPPAPDLPTPARSATAHSERQLRAGASAVLQTPAPPYPVPRWLSDARSGATAQANAPIRITEPSSGTIVALDPDIPPVHQRLLFRSNATAAQGKGLRWRTAHGEFGQGNTQLWLPMPGRHTVELRNADGQVLDRIALEVRGAGIKLPKYSGQ